MIESKRGFLDRVTGTGFQTRIRYSHIFPSLFRGDVIKDMAIDINIPNPPFITDNTSIFSDILLIYDTSGETIRLKDKDKKLVDYEDTEATNAMREKLLAWNNFAQHFRPDIFLSDQEFRAVRLEPDDDDETPDRPIDLTRRSLYRVFNNRSFEEGGRLYGGWWQGVPSELRRFITIDGMRTVEIDYSNMQPAMLYAMQGEHLPADAYEVDGIDASFRKLIKTTFMKMLNAMPGQNMRPPRREELPDGMSFNDLMQAIRERHEPIAHHFRSGIGLRLQKDDAEIALEILLQGMNERRLVLPIHDSFIVQKRNYAYRLRDLMIEKYHARYGVKIDVKIDTPFPLEPQIVYINDTLRQAPEIEAETLNQRRRYLAARAGGEAYGGYRRRNSITAYKGGDVEIDDNDWPKDSL